MNSVLDGYRVVQIGNGLAAAVCGRLLLDVGADITCIGPGNPTPLVDYLNHGKTIDPGAARAALTTADLIVCEGRPRDLRVQHYDAASLRRLNARAALVLISPFGQTGPQANDPATDLTLFFASGIARLLTGQVDDLSEPPIRPVGEQSAFIGGVAAACAGMHAALAAEPGGVIDVSIQEALATPGPVLVEAVIDPYEPPMPPKIEADQALKFAKALAKGTPKRMKIATTILEDKVRELV